MGKIKSAKILWEGREKRISLGGENSESVFYVIRRNCPHNGIASDLLVFLGHLMYMEKNHPGAIPIVDMQNYTQGISDTKGNAWETFFYQPNDKDYSIDSISNSRNIILSNLYFDRKGRIPCDYDWNILKNQGWDTIFKKYIKIKSELMAEFDKEWIELLNGIGEERVIGLKLRGTDYLLGPIKHNVQPVFEQIEGLVDELLSEGCYERIFLATEDVMLREKAIAKWGELIIETPKKFINWSGQEAINDNAISKDINTKDYLREMIFLSKCASFVSGNNSGAIISILMNEGRFLKTRILDCGKY